jgi:peroxiredoxin Q/BCP
MKLIFFVLACIVAFLLWRGLRPGHPPQPGEMAPDFRLPNQDGVMTTLSQSSGAWRVLYFYPKDDTPGCTQEACRFRDDFSALQALGAVVIGISLDTTASHAEFAGKYRLPFILLSDPSGDTVRAYGAMMNFGLIKMARRYTFLIDPQGRISARFLSVNPSSHASDVIETLKKLQHRQG